MSSLMAPSDTMMPDLDVNPEEVELQPERPSIKKFRKSKQLSASINEYKYFQEIRKKQKELEEQQAILQRKNKTQMEYHNLTLEISQVLASYVKQKKELLKLEKEERREQGEEGDEEEKKEEVVNLKRVADVNQSADFQVAEAVLREKERKHRFNDEMDEYKEEGDTNIDMNVIREEKFLIHKTRKVSS